MGNQASRMGWKSTEVDQHSGFHQNWNGSLWGIKPTKLWGTEPSYCFGRYLLGHDGICNRQHDNWVCLKRAISPNCQGERVLDLGGTLFIYNFTNKPQLTARKRSAEKWAYLRQEIGGNELNPADGCEILHHQFWMVETLKNPKKSWEKVTINWCWISSISSLAMKTPSLRPASRRLKMAASFKAVIPSSGSIETIEHAGFSSQRILYHLGMSKAWFSQVNIWLFNSSPWKPWPIEIDGLPINSMVYLLNCPFIDGLPIKNGDFPWQTASHNQMVSTMTVFRSGRSSSSAAFRFALAARRSRTCQLREPRGRTAGHKDMAAMGTMAVSVVHPDWTRFKQQQWRFITNHNGNETLWYVIIIYKFIQPMSYFSCVSEPGVHLEIAIVRGEVTIYHCFFASTPLSCKPTATIFHHSNLCFTLKQDIEHLQLSVS